MNSFIKQSQIQDDQDAFFTENQKRNISPPGQGRTSKGKRLKTHATIQDGLYIGNQLSLEHDAPK